MHVLGCCGGGRRHATAHTEPVIVHEWIVQRETRRREGEGQRSHGRGRSRIFGAAHAASQSCRAGVLHEDLNDQSERSREGRDESSREMVEA